ncbi:SnoaL-like domain-containing protein [Streptomyces sp. WMMB 714]|jgi:hypothetical protein|uniref:nuclear transport factor 2 family protein n=1 Tax=Streptomyces sp. WMMB 714 TaxID=1286822 RepID=UPI0005F88F2C|nr:nuclear transport factor 2 family protein [Streptomyces sp. WMMB 714]SCK44245.1 SnoaL-like domain-containing protein [Streptomyces sp. WMMB 714]
MAAANRFRTAVDNRDLAALEGLLTEDVRLYSPVTFEPFAGRHAVLGLFGVLLRTFEDFRYIGELDGAAETASDAVETPSAALVFRSTVNGRQIHGVDLLHLDQDERIREITVMVRPQSAVQTLGEAVLAGLVADGQLPGAASA